MSPLLSPEKVIDKIQGLPTLPIIAMKVVKLAQSDKSTAQELAKVIEIDQALSTKVIKLVNSAYYGLPRRIYSVREAVVIMGFEVIKSLALSISVLQVFKSDESIDFPREEFWKHSLGCGVASKLVGELIGMNKNQLEALFLAGLLHDIGKIVEDEYFHKEFLIVLGTVKKRNISFFEAEKLILGTDHAIIGGQLAEKWQLPGDISDVIKCHHRPSSALSDNKQFVTVVHFGDILCKTKSLGYSGDYDIQSLAEQDVLELEISEDKLDDLLERRLEPEFEKASLFFKLAKDG